jgi:hypothetical protein
VRSLRLWSNRQGIPDLAGIDGPSQAQIEAFVLALDGAAVNEGGLIVLVAEAPVGMMYVGGGIEDRVALYWQWATGGSGTEGWDTDLFALVDRRQGSEMFATGAGGQTVEQPGRWSVPKPAALRAMLRFADTLELDEDLDWDFEPSPPGVARPLSRTEVRAVNSKIQRRASLAS